MGGVGGVPDETCTSICCDSQPVRALETVHWLRSRASWYLREGVAPVGEAGSGIGWQPGVAGADLERRERGWPREGKDKQSASYVWKRQCR